MSAIWIVDRWTGDAWMASSWMGSSLVHSSRIGDEWLDGCGICCPYVIFSFSIYCSYSSKVKKNGIIFNGYPMYSRGLSIKITSYRSRIQNWVNIQTRIFYSNWVNLIRIKIMIGYINQNIQT